MEDKTKKILAGAALLGVGVFTAKKLKSKKATKSQDLNS